MLFRSSIYFDSDQDVARADQYPNLTAAVNAANYGGIGAVIGHEIGHGFDDQGSKYDGDGNLKDWWTQTDREKFDKLTHSLIDQYDQFTPQDVADKYTAQGKADQMPHVKGAFTIGENIGDLGGVNISLKAYALSLGAQDRKSVV